MGFYPISWCHEHEGGIQSSGNFEISCLWQPCLNNKSYGVSLNSIKLYPCPCRRRPNRLSSWRWPSCTLPLCWWCLSIATSSSRPGGRPAPHAGQHPPPPTARPPVRTPRYVAIRCTLHIANHCQVSLYLIPTNLAPATRSPPLQFTLFITEPPLFARRSSICAVHILIQTSQKLCDIRLCKDQPSLPQLSDILGVFLLPAAHTYWSWSPLAQSSPYTHSLLAQEEETIMVSTSWRSAFFSHEYHVRLILLGSLLHWKNQLPVGGVPVYSQMSRSKSQFSQLSLVLGLQENGELLPEVETTMVSSSWIRRECVYRVPSHHIIPTKLLA